MKYYVGVSLLHRQYWCSTPLPFVCYFYFLQSDSCNHHYQLTNWWHQYCPGTDAAQNQEDVNNIRQAMKSAKGPGNFRNLFMYSPNGKKDGIQIIPLSEVAAKDEFLNIKNVSRDDMMAAHRVPPQMMGIIPNNTGGFGDVEKASRVFVRNELMPLQKRLQELNDWLGEEVIRFEPYTLDIEN